MNIQLLTPKILRNDIITCSNHTDLNASNASYPNLKPLNQDTVSFGIKMPKADTTTIEDIITIGYENEYPVLKALSTRLLDTMEVIASELKDTGLMFDKAYNQKAPIKSSASYISKWKRSCAEPKDPARGTWYLQNIHDLSILNDKILPALESRGYKIAPVSGKKKIPDFDVRLSGVSEKSKSALPKNLRDAASFKEQGSGYADIQFRLIDKFAPKGSRKFPLEIIIVAGENTAKAKIDESYYVYDIVRVLKNELHVSEISDPEIHTPAYRIKGNIGIITRKLQNQISQPLFENAKKLDIEKDLSQLEVVALDANSTSVLPGLVEGIKNKIPLHYNAKIKEIRMDKTLSGSEKKQKVQFLEKQMEDDLKIINFVKGRLKETIEKYGTKS